MREMAEGDIMLKSFRAYFLGNSQKINRLSADCAQAGRDNAVFMYGVVIK